MRNIKPEKIFFCLAFIFGLSFILITPPFQTPDEPSHYFRAIQLSDFSIIGDKVEGVSGAYLPSHIVEMTKDLVNSDTICGALAAKIDKADIEEIRHYLLTSNKHNDKKELVDFKNTVIYSPVVYFPQALGIGIARILHLPPLWTFYFGRLLNVLLFVFMVSAAIKIIPVFKWGLSLFALMPMTLSIATSFSADTLTIALSFLMIAYILRLGLDTNRRVESKSIIWIGFLSIFLGLSKYAYMALPLLFLVVPYQKIGSRFKQYAYLLLFFVVSILGAILWFFAIQEIYIPYNLTANASEQIQFILSNPVEFLKVNGNVFNLYILNSFIGNLGWLDVPLPLWFVYAYVLVIFLNAVLEDADNTYFSAQQRWIIVGIIILVFVSLTTILYVSNVDVGVHFITVLQGRYFIPFAPLILLPFAMRIAPITRLRKHYSSISSLLIPVFIVTSLSYTVWVLFQRYYGL